MSSVNKVILVGRLGADPKEVGNGTVAKFTLVTNDRYKTRDGEKKEEADWHTILCFGNTAEFAVKYLKKGYLVYVEGKVKPRKYEDNGVTKYITEIKADVVKNMTPRPEPQDNDLKSDLNWD